MFIGRVEDFLKNYNKYIEQGTEIFDYIEGVIYIYVGNSFIKSDINVDENFGAQRDQNVLTLQSIGTKYKGYRYYDTQNKVMLLCVQNTDITYPNLSFFEQIDNVSLNKKIKETVKISEYSFEIGELTFVTSTVSNNGASYVDVVFDKPFKNKCLNVILTNYGNHTTSTRVELGTITERGFTIKWQQYEANDPVRFTAFGY